ncbi:MAG: PAS domain-containing protein [Tagaea sp.]
MFVRDGFVDFLRTPRAREFWAFFSPLVRARGFVRRDDFLPEDIPRLLGNLVLLDRRADSYFYRLVGSNIAGQHGRDLTGRGLAEWPAPNAATIRAQYDRVLADRAPILAHYSGPAYCGGRFELVERRWEKLALPLAVASGEPDGVLVCACECPDSDPLPACFAGTAAGGCWCATPGVCAR